MKTTKIILGLAILVCFNSIAQTNRFPADGDVIILPSANVGIGTSQPKAKLHVNSNASKALTFTRDKASTFGFEIGGSTFGLYNYTDNLYHWRTTAGNLLLAEASGSVTIGSTKTSQNYKLNLADKSSSVRMAFSNDTFDDKSILEFHSSKQLRFQHWTNNNWKKTIMALDLPTGNVGIGIIKPIAKFDVLSNPGQTETLARFHISDAPGDYFKVENSTSSANQFIPVIKGHHVSDNRYSIQLSGSTTAANDTGDNALVNFDARRLDGPILTRPLFVWTSYRKKFMTMTSNGDLAIGTTKTNGYKLSVNGNIRATEVKVYTGWADYVFKEDYQLPTLQEVAKHIAEKGHLINIPSATEVAANGIQLGVMNAKLLEKIEELTLYTLEQEEKLKKITTLEAKNTALEARLERIELLLEKK